MDDFYASLFGCSAIEEKDLDLHRRLSLSSFASPFQVPSLKRAMTLDGHARIVLGSHASLLTRRRSSKPRFDADPSRKLKRLFSRLSEDPNGNANEVLLG